MASLETDKSVRVIGLGAYNPRVETRGYPELVNDRDQLNPLIYRWDNAPPTHNPSSVSTDYLVPHVKTWGYSDYNLFDNRIWANPPIHRWDNTSYPYNPLSVLTDYRIQTQAEGE